MSAPRINVAARLEDVAFMAETGETLTGAARRLGMTRTGLEKWLRRHAPAALDALAAREGDERTRAAGLARWAS